MMAKIQYIGGEFEEFKAVKEQFDHMVSKINSDELARIEHGELERWLVEEGTELLRRFAQGYFDKRASEEQVLSSIEGADSLERRNIKEGCQKDLMTLFGEVEIKRRGYSRHGAQALFPLDAQLNLPKDKYSHGLRRRSAENALKSSFDETVATVAATTGGKVPKRQAEEIAVEMTEDFKAFYEARRAKGPELSTDLLILTLDGKGIVMRQESLREATQKAAEREKSKGKTRLAAGEKSNRKRMATVAAVYSSQRHVQRAESIMKQEKSKEDKKKPKPQNKRVWASVKEDAVVVCEDVFQEALRRDPENRRSWAVLVDGNLQQLSNIDFCIAKHEIKDITLVLDFIHVMEYLWEAAHSFDFKSSEETEEWVRQRALLILQGKVSDVAAGIRRSATLRKLSAQARKTVDTAVNYFLKYTDMMKYDKYLANGFPIATGVIEGACRHLIKDRMDITGARWGLERAEAILKLRALKSSGDFEEYFSFYKAQSRQRNHISRYKFNPLQLAA
jgi:hypothetical protein